MLTNIDRARARKISVSGRYQCCNHKWYQVPNVTMNNLVKMVRPTGGGGGFRTGRPSCNCSEVGNLDLTPAEEAAIVAFLKIYAGAPHGLIDTHKNQLNSDLLTFLKT